MFHVKQSADSDLLCGVIKLSKDGEWFHEGVEITHERTVELFNRSIRKENGRYVLRVGDEVCDLVIEDAPFIVRRVDRDGDGLLLHLSNLTSVPLDTENLEVGDGNVLYARVGPQKDRARFSRPAYYQLAEFLHQEKDGRYFLLIGNKSFPLKI